jgi:Tfp pilus assembly protein PilN
MMIKVNLSPNRKRRKTASGGKKKVETQTSPGSVVLGIFALGWVLVGGGLWWTLDQKQIDTQKKKAEAARMKKEIKKIKEQIDEEYLQAVKARYEQLKVAIAKLEAQKRTPMYVMNEMMNVLTQGKLPDINEEEQRKVTTADPDAELNPMWDASSVWITNMEENGNILKIEGGARDASDLSEFLKRLRASSRFAGVSHPNYKLVEDKKGTSAKVRRYISFKLTARVTQWD